MSLDIKIDFEFREAVFVGKTAKSARKIECIADRFRILDDGVSVAYRHRIQGSNLPLGPTAEESGKEMDAVSLFQAAVSILGSFMWVIQGALLEDSGYKLFIEFEGKVIRAEWSDVFGGLKYPVDEYSFARKI